MIYAYLYAVVYAKTMNALMSLVEFAEQSAQSHTTAVLLRC
jgi:hypothetical protein